MRLNSTILLALSILLGCAHKRTPAEERLIGGRDCTQLLKAADAARAAGRPDVAQDLAQACTQSGLDALVARSTPEEALLACGRARAAQPDGGKLICDSATVANLAGQLRPRLRVGPADPESAPDPLVSAAVTELSGETNLIYAIDSPEVIVGRMTTVIDHVMSGAMATALDARGMAQRVPATQHRFIARAEAQVELGGKTRVLRATDEARDLTWVKDPRLAVPARMEPSSVPSPDELRHRAARAWVRALAKALASAPPEAVEINDARGCVAYGLALNLAAGDSSAAVSRSGDLSRMAACEKLLGEPAGAGIPVP